MENIRWNEKENDLEDIERLVLLIDELDFFRYEEIQNIVRENKSLFNEYFNGLHDVEGVTRPISRKLNYHLNILETSNKIKQSDMSDYHKTDALKREANRIREENEEEMLKNLVEYIVRNCVDVTNPSSYPFLRHPCSDTFIKEYIEERRKMRR